MTDEEFTNPLDRLGGVAPPRAETTAEAIHGIRSEGWWVAALLAFLAAPTWTTLASSGLPGLAGMSDAEVIVRAAFATLALTLGVFGAAYLAMSGQLKRGYAGWLGFGGSLFAGNAVAAAFGRWASDAPLHSTSPSGLADYAGRVLADNVATFGPAPTVSGIVVGVITARWAIRLSRAL